MQSGAAWAQWEAAPTDGSMISVAQPADLIGISRAAVYKAIEKGGLRVRRIGNVTVVDSKSATEYTTRRRRRGRGARERQAHAPWSFGPGASRASAH